MAGNGINSPRQQTSESQDALIHVTDGSLYGGIAIEVDPVAVQDYLHDSLHTDIQGRGLEVAVLDKKIGPGIEDHARGGLTSGRYVRSRNQDTRDRIEIYAGPLAESASLFFGQLTASSYILGGAYPVTERSMHEAMDSLAKRTDLLGTELACAKRLAGYLLNQEIPVQRKTDFLERLYLLSLQRKMNEDFIHELRHYAQDYARDFKAGVSLEEVFTLMAQRDKIKIAYYKEVLKYGIHSLYNTMAIILLSRLVPDVPNVSTAAFGIAGVALVISMYKFLSGDTARQFTDDMAVSSYLLHPRELDARQHVRTIRQVPRLITINKRGSSPTK